MAYTIRKTFAMHESGTKRYETFEITGGKRGVLVTSWGPHKAGEFIGIRSVSRSKVQDLREGEVAWEGDIVRRNKGKRGYKETSNIQEGFTSDSSIRGHLNGLFHRDIVEKVMSLLVVGISSSVSEDKPVEAVECDPEIERLFGNAPKTSVKEVVSEKPKSEEWGSW